MQSVTSEWLHERGQLHDARVTDVRISGSKVEFALDDERANERGLAEGDRMGVAQSVGDADSVFTAANIGRAALRTGAFAGSGEAGRIAPIRLGDLRPRAFRTDTAIARTNSCPARPE